MIRSRIDSVRAILVPQPGLCSYQSPPLEAARAPALRSAVWGWPGCHSHNAGLLGTLGRGPSGWPPGIMVMVAFDQGSRAVVKRPSLRDSGAIPVQYHVALRGTGGIFANPSGREGGRVGCMRVSAGRRPYVLIVNPGLCSGRSLTFYPCSCRRSGQSEPGMSQPRAR